MNNKKQSKEIPNQETLNAIKEIENIEKGKIKTKTYKNKEELMKNLLK